MKFQLDHDQGKIETAPIKQIVIPLPKIHVQERKEKLEKIQMNFLVTGLNDIKKYPSHRWP